MKRIAIPGLIAIMLVFFTGSATPGYAASRKKVKVVSVVFRGNEGISGNRLREAMVTHPSQIFNPSYYNEEILREDIRSVELLYRQYGYLDATVTGFRADVDSTRFRAAIEITVSEGEQTRIEGVSILGNAVYSDSLLMNMIDVQPGQDYRQKKIDDSTVRLLTWYADNGYLDAEASPDIKVNTDTHTALIDYAISEKSQYSIGEIRIQGLDKTRETVVRRELLFKPGEVVNYSRLLKTQRNIYLTGLFQSAFIRPLATADGNSATKDILVDLRESMSGEFSVAAGYGSVDRVRGKIEAFNHNVRGTALKLGLVGRISFVRRGVETSFTNPWTFGTQLRSDVNLMVERRSEPGYDVAQIGGRATLGRKIGNTTPSMTYRHEQATLSNIQSTDIPENLKSNVRSLKASIIYDTRDNLFNSTRGLYLETSAEFGAYLTGKTHGFYRLGCTARYFLPAGRRTVIATSADLGFIDAAGGFNNIPLYDRQYAGGPSSLRGFAYEKAGPLDARRVPTGGRLKVVLNVFEIRRTLYRMVSGAAFLDVGNVWKQHVDFTFRGMRVSPGLGLRVITPIGLGRLDYGFNIDRREKESFGEIYFSMGQAF